VTSVAAGIVCKMPIAGQSKTRLCPPLRPEECAHLSACFIQDLACTIDSLVGQGGVTGYAVYTPAGSESALQQLLPKGFRLFLQCEGSLGLRLLHGISGLLDAGHCGAILINSDSPTLPMSILDSAIEALRGDACVVLSPAIDGGYTLIGLSRPHARLFEDIPWSTHRVYELTLERAKEIGLPVVKLPAWYDVDDANSLAILDQELAGIAPQFLTVPGADAPATRQFMNARRSSLRWRSA
jgi:uncharacterized protein